MTKKEEILKQSLKLLRQKGYFNTSISDLAEANGLVKSHFYHYFLNKEQLMEEVLKMNVLYIEKNIFSICHAENISDKEKLNKVFLGMYKYFSTEKGGCIMGNTAIETSGLIKQFEDILKIFFKKMESAISLLFLNRQGSKMAAKTGRRFVKEFQGALMVYKLYKDPSILSETLDDYKSIFKNSIKK